MKKNINSISRFIKMTLVFFVVSGLYIIPAYSQQMPGMKMDTTRVKDKAMKDMQEKMMLPMAFFTHMGMPLSVGTFGIRVASLITQNEEGTKTEFNFQFETGLSKTVGLFVGGEKLFSDATLEAMVQFLVLKSKNGMNGFSPLIEFEFPLGREAKRRVYTLVGFASTISNSHIAFNQVIHYSPLEDLVEGSASFVIKISRQIFIVSEISGVTEKGEPPIFNLLAGIKVKVARNFLLGFAYQFPLTSNRDYTSQYVFQPNLMLYK